MAFCSGKIVAIYEGVNGSSPRLDQRPRRKSANRPCTGCLGLIPWFGGPAKKAHAERLDTKFNLPLQLRHLSGTQVTNAGPVASLGGESKRDQKRNRKIDFRRDWSDATQDQRNRSEDVRRHYRDPRCRPSDRATQLRRVRGQEASGPQSAQSANRRTRGCRGEMGGYVQTRQGNGRTSSPARRGRRSRSRPRSRKFLPNARTRTSGLTFLLEQPI